jgi:hypothetical protein
MAAVHWAADLATKLEATGTPPAKLKCVRDAMAERWAATGKLAPSDPERHLTAAEAVGVIEQRYGADHGTAVKARAIRETGAYEPPPPAAHPAELIPPPPAVEREPEREVQTPAPGPAPAPDAPGVIDPAAEVPSVGPKPVEAKRKK